MSAWVLPDHIADVLPSEARHIEELRRELLDTARGYGYELVMPPLLEHLESLLPAPARRSTCRPSSWSTSCPGRMHGPARRHHAAGRPHRRPPAQSPGRGAPVLLRPGAAHPPRPPARHARAAAVRRRDLRPCRPRSRPRSAAAGAGLPARPPACERAHRRHGRCPHRARRCSPACRSTPRRWRACMPRWPPRTRASCARSRATFPPPSREGLLALVQPVRRREGAATKPQECLPRTRRPARRRWPTCKWLAGHLDGATRQLRPGRPARLRLLQRHALRHLHARRQRCAGARRPLRRGRRRVRPQPAGRRLQPGRAELVGVLPARRCKAAIRAPWLDGTPTRPTARRHRRTARRRARPWSACCRATTAKSTNSTATASSSSSAGQWSRASPSESSIFRNEL